MKALLSITGRILLMATLLIVVIPPAIAQPAAYNFHHLKPSDGLSDGDVHCIAQDKYGFIWIGTSYGLNRFDGINIKTYFTRRNDSNSLRYNYVHAIYPGKNGDLWIGTLRGLCRFDYSQGQFVNYKAPRNLSILDIKEDRQGKLWLATEKGLWTVDETTRSIQEFTRNGDSIFLKHFNTRIRQILPTASGQLYFATYRGIKYFNPITSRYGEIKHDSIAGSAYPDIIYSLALDRDDHLWAVSINPQPVLNRINLRDNSITRYSNKSKAPASWAGNFLNQVVVDRNGRIWVVGSRSGLTVFEPGMNTFTEYHSDPLQPKSLLNNHNTFLYEDKDGIMWIGTLGYGVSYFNPDRNLFSTIQPDPENKKSLPGAWCRSACEDMDGNLWLGTGSGLARYNRQSQTFTVFANDPNNEKPTVLYSNSVRALMTDKDGDIWIGTSSGLNRYRPKTGKMDFFDERHGMPRVFFWMMDNDKNGQQWFGSSSGIFRYIPSQNRFDNLQSDPVLGKYARSNYQALFIDSRNCLWAGLHSRGILVYDINKKSARLLTIEAGEILDSRTSAFAEDRSGVIWIGSEEGLVGYDPFKKTSRFYTREDGLSSDRTNNLMVDSLDRLWIGTSNGLCMLDKDRKTFKKFGVNDGLLNNQFNSQSACRTRDGLFVFPMYAGFLLFKPENYRENNSVTPVYITSFEVDGTELPTNENPEAIGKIKLRHYQNFFRINLAGLNYLNPSQCTYLYKLEGFDKDWVQTSKREISYTNVPAGSYRFCYKVITPDNTSADVPEKSVEIRIAAVFYKTWWFQLMVALAIAAMLFAFYKYRMHARDKIYSLQSKAQTLEKEKAVVQYDNLKQQLNPHFLFNSLSSLKSLIRIDKNDAADFLEKMSATYRYILKTSENELVTLHEEIRFLESYIDLQRARFGKAFEVSLTVNDELSDKKIVPVTLQNLVENAIKHNQVDRDSPLRVWIYDEQGYLVVKNNYQPREFVETSNRHGLKQLRSLYQYLEHRPIIIEQEDEFFIVKIPLI